jgi:hypothetical protein
MSGFLGSDGVVSSWVTNPMIIINIGDEKLNDGKKIKS